MSTTSVMADARVGPGNAMAGQQVEVDFAECDCCGLTEECTLSYIQAIRERYGGKWICGLCAEAVKEEVFRCGKPDEAMARHLSFCSSFRASGPPREDCSLLLIRALSRVLRRGLEGPKSVPGSPMGRGGGGGGVLTRSESCISEFNPRRGG